MVRNVAILQDVDNVADKINHGEVSAYVNYLMHGSKPTMTPLPDGTTLIGRSISRPSYYIDIPSRVIQWFEQNSIEYWTRVKINNTVYHSLAYKRKRSSGSHFVKIKSGHHFVFGNVLHYISTCHASFALVRLYEILPNLLFHDIDFYDEQIEQLVENNIFGSGFTHLRLSKEVSIFESLKIVYLCAN